MASAEMAVGSKNVTQQTHGPRNESRLNFHSNWDTGHNENTHVSANSRRITRLIQVDERESIE